MALPLRQTTTRALGCLVEGKVITLPGYAPTPNTQIREKGHSNSNPIQNLPAYTYINQIKYYKFVQQLKRMNKTVCKYQQKEVRKALESTIIEIVGSEEFRWMKGGPSNEKEGAKREVLQRFGPNGNG